MYMCIPYWVQVRTHKKGKMLPNYDKENLSFKRRVWRTPKKPCPRSSLKSKTPNPKAYLNLPKPTFL